LRFGIGQEQKVFDQVKFVLDKWETEEEKALPKRIERCSEAVLSFGLQGVQNTMNQYNGT
jgi:PTH1 family peptidyl-tRNA hydrolase